MTDQEKDPVVHSSLSKPLFISSALLVLSWAGRLYDEVYGTRPWKGYEARFEKVYSRFLKETLPQEATLRKADQSVPGVQEAGSRDAGRGEGRRCRRWPRSTGR
jgi:hypothetical protein